MSQNQQRTVVVTGASRGIGLACVEAFLADGERVILLDVLEDALEAQVERLRGAGGDVFGYPVDVADESSIAEAKARITAAGMSVDVLVNNAGIGGDAGSVGDVAVENWDRVFGVNARGVYSVSRAFLPELVANGGALVNVASAFGMVGVRGYPAYCASKGAVVALTRQMAVDYGPRGVRVNAVAPGYIANDMGDSLSFMDADAAERAWQAREDAAALQPLTRQGSVREVASVVHFLAGPAASFVSGVTVPVDGGMLVALNDGGPRS